VCSHCLFLSLQGSFGGHSDRRLTAWIGTVIHPTPPSARDFPGRMTPTSLGGRRAGSRPRGSDPRAPWLARSTTWRGPKCRIGFRSSSAVKKSARSSGASKGPFHLQPIHFTAVAASLRLRFCRVRRSRQRRTTGFAANHGEPRHRRPRQVFHSQAHRRELQRGDSNVSCEGRAAIAGIGLRWPQPGPGLTRGLQPSLSTRGNKTSGALIFRHFRVRLCRQRTRWPRARPRRPLSKKFGGQEKVTSIAIREESPLTLRPFVT
jgi:hypothetical protein